MSEPAAPRSRWRRATVIMLLVILIALGGTWWWLSRLNSVEKALVGDWRVVYQSKEVSTIRFHSNRTVDISNPDQPTVRIRWFARGDRFTLGLPVHVTLWQWVRSGFWDRDTSVYAIQSSEPDHVVVIHPESGPESFVELFRVESPP